MWKTKKLLEYFHNISRKRYMAWCKLDFYCLGSYTWFLPDHRKNVGRTKMQLWIARKDSKNYTPIAGAQFQLKNTDYTNATGIVTTGSDGKCWFTINGEGTYYIYETEAPSGYDITQQINYQSGRGSYRGYIIVDSDGSYYAYYYGTLISNSAHNLSISMYNEKKLGGFKLTKRDSYDSSLLPGVWLFITKENKTIGWDNYRYRHRLPYFRKNHRYQGDAIQAIAHRDHPCSNL